MMDADAGFVTLEKMKTGVAANEKHLVNISEEVDMSVNVPSNAASSRPFERRCH